MAFPPFTKEQRSAFGKKGGANKPNETRGFCISRAIAVRAGRKGGSSKKYDPKRRPFSADRDLARRAWKLGIDKALAVRRKNKEKREQVMKDAIAKKKRRVHREKRRRKGERS